MPQARDIMTGSLTTCSPQDSVAEAAQLMRDRNIGDVLVTDEGKLVGILTDRDIAVRVTAKTRDPEQVPVRDVMSSHVLTGEPSWDLDQIAQRMGKHQVRRLPIVENGIPVGIVSFGDMARQLQRVTLGASSAENEVRDLAAYYLEIDAFRRALRGEVRMVETRSRGRHAPLQT